jgi:hypothetical protein
MAGMNDYPSDRPALAMGAVAPAQVVLKKPA